MSRLWQFLSQKGPLFALNLVVLIGIAISLVLVFSPQSAVETVASNAARLIALGAVAVFILYAFLLGRRGNRWLLPVFALVCVACEIILQQAIGSRPATAADVQWRRVQPYFMFSGPPGGTVEMPAAMGGSVEERQARFNNDGFRIETEITIPKPKDEVRIFVLGGSTVMVGAPLSNAIPGLIETSLRAMGLAGARVYNFGVISFNSNQELALLVQRLTAYEPDLVVAYDGGNDLSAPWIYDPRPGYPYNFGVWEAAVSALTEDSRPTLRKVADVATGSTLVRMLYGRRLQEFRYDLEGLRRASDYGSDRWKHKIVDNYARTIAAMCRVSRSYGFLFAAFFQPTLPYSENLNAARIQLANGEQFIKYMREMRDSVLAAAPARLLEAAPASACRFSDLSRLFENDGSEHYWDFIHIDNRGNQLVGRRIAEELVGWQAFSVKSRVKENSN